MDSTTRLADELRASASAGRELGADYDPAVVQAFLERVDREVDHRVDRRIAAARAAGSTGWTTLLLALGALALGLGVPSATHDHFGTAASYVLTLLVWCAIVAVNVAHARARRPPR